MTVTISIQEQALEQFKKDIEKSNVHLLQSVIDSIQDECPGDEAFDMRQLSANPDINGVLAQLKKQIDAVAKKYPFQLCCQSLVEIMCLLLFITRLLNGLSSFKLDQLQNSILN